MIGASIGLALAPRDGMNFDELFGHSDLALYMGLVVYYTLIGQTFYMTLAAVAMASSFMVSYSRARAESLIPSCKVGFMERPERLVLLIMGGAFNRMAQVLWVIATISTITVIHRVVANFVIQGGGHDAASYALKATHENVFNESGNGLQNKRGTVGMARGDAPHSGNAQFYVNLVDNPDLDPVSTRWGYTVFGRIVQGMDVIDHIGETPTGSVGPFKSDAPLKPVIIEKMEMVAAGATSSAPVITPVPPRQDTILSPK